MADIDKDVTRARQKLTAAHMAKLRLKQRFEAIDYRLDVVLPELKALEEDLANGRLVSIEMEPLALPPARKKR